MKAECSPTDDIDTFERACLVGQVNRIAGIDLVGAKYEELQPLGLGMKFRAHPLGIGIAQVQLDKLDTLNARRKAYVEAVEAGLKDIPGLRPLRQYDGAERGGFYAFPVIHDPEAMGGVETDAFIAACTQSGLEVTRTPYPDLHTLPLFAKGFDIFTRDRGPLCASSGYKGYAKGDFPQAEFAARRTLFLPRLSDPVPNAPELVLETLQKAAELARS